MTIIHQKIILPSVLVFLVLSLYWGCYPKRVGPVGPDEKRLTWTEMSVLQRKAHMKSVVLPRAPAWPRNVGFSSVQGLIGMTPYGFMFILIS
jgi:hypothetical protein